MSDKKPYEIVLDLGIVYAESEDEAWMEADRILHRNSSVDFSVAPYVGEDAAFRAEVERLTKERDAIENLYRIGQRQEDAWRAEVERLRGLLDTASDVIEEYAPGHTILLADIRAALSAKKDGE